MTKIKKILLFSYGSSYDASSWSNIPFLMRESLEGLGINVICQNLLLNRFYRKITNFLIKKDKYYSDIRLPFTRFLVQKKIDRFIRKHRDADFCLFLNFDYSQNSYGIPSLILSDWTYEILLNRDEKTVLPRDREFINHQKKTIQKASIVVSLFEESFLIMLNTYPKANIHLLDQNVVNILDHDKSIDPLKIIKDKFNSDYILFIGRNHYNESLKILIQSIEVLDNLQLHVIGINGEDTEKVKFHGWLKKDKDVDNKKYYNLIRKAKICINTTQGWAGYSSIIEAMYYYTPIIVYPFNQFKKEFGEDLKCGYYSDGTIEDVSSKIKKIGNLNFEAYKNMALHAHTLVKGYTWENYAKKLVSLMEDHLQHNIQK